MASLDVIIYIISFFALLFGSGLIIKAINKFSHRLKLSTFSASFFILGMLTSIPEFAVGLTSIAENKPDIFTGNLIGGIAIIFFLVIPILAVLGNGVAIGSQISKNNLLVSFLAMLSPAIALYDRKITNLEGSILILVYFILFFIVEQKRGIFDKNTEVFKIKSYSLVDIVKIVVGVLIVFISSQVIVDSTLVVAKDFGVSAFYISLIALSFGTNLPEFSLAIKSVIERKKSIALGDYMGSASANIFLFGLLTLIASSEVMVSRNFVNTFILIGIGLAIFFWLAISKGGISRKEGFCLIIYYVVFASLELL